MSIVYIQFTHYPTKSSSMQLQRKTVHCDHRIIIILWLWQIYSKMCFFGFFWMYDCLIDSDDQLYFIRSFNYIIKLIYPCAVSQVFLFLSIEYCNHRQKYMLENKSAGEWISKIIKVRLLSWSLFWICLSHTEYTR